MRIISLGFVPLITLTCLAAGCWQEVESTDVRTSGVYPVIDVTADGSGSTRVEVKLKVAGRASTTFLELTGEDRFTATAGGKTKDLIESGSVSYAAAFPDDVAGPYTIAFLRGPADTSAPSTTVDCRLHSLRWAAAEVSRATGTLPLTWTPAGADDLDVSLLGTCVGLTLKTIPDDGAATIAGDELIAQRADDACTVTLTLARRRSGDVDPAFTEGGHVEARQVRDATFTTAP